MRRSRSGLWANPAKFIAVEFGRPIGREFSLKRAQQSEMPVEVVRPMAAKQFEAGERLRADYWFAHLSQRVTSNWSALVPSERSRRAAPSSAAAFSDNALAAKQRAQHALCEVGPELAGVLVDVCCELKGLEDAEKENGWSQRAGKVVLQIALTRLARHYGLIREEGARPGSRRLRH